jgi:hypothetical protein
MQSRKDVERIATYLEDHARGPDDNQAAHYLRHLLRVHNAAYEMMHAKTHEHSRAAYQDMKDALNGKPE